MQSTDKSKSWLKIAAILGASAVILGAFGAHALKDTLLSNGSIETWKTAVFYHFLHTFLILIAQNKASELKAVKCTCIASLSGILLFSGSLYLLALGGPKWLGPITPLGGLAFIIAWISLFFTTEKK